MGEPGRPHHLARDRRWPRVASLGMEPLSQLRADDVVEVLVAAQESMRAHAPALDRLDRLDQLDGIDGGDTGQHLLDTLDAVVGAIVPGGTLTQLAADLEGVVVTAGVGRAGRLLAAFVGGVAELCRNADALDPMRLAMAFEAGSDAVAEISPDARAGALPSVAEVVAEVALRCADEGRSLAELVIEVADRGLDALERTPELWPPLADAGVVDAGGAGLLVLVDAFVAVVHGDDPELPEWEFPDDVDDDGEAFADERFRYEITLSLAAPAGADPAIGPQELGKLLQRAWVALGDEVQLLTAGGRLTASVCTDDIGAVIEAAVGLGRPSEIVVRDRRG